MARRSVVLAWSAWMEERGCIGGCGKERRRVVRSSGRERRRDGSESGGIERGERRGVVREVSRRI